MSSHSGAETKNSYLIQVANHRALNTIKKNVISGLWHNFYYWSVTSDSFLLLDNEVHDSPDSTHTVLNILTVSRLCPSSHNRELSFPCALPQACNILTIVNLTQKLWTDADVDSFEYVAGTFMYHTIIQHIYSFFLQEVKLLLTLAH